MSVGENLIRKDGRAKVTGAAAYVDDIRPEGCLYGATVRSTHAHARIANVRADSAFDWTDITVVTARDIPGENVVALMTDDQPVLADGLVRHATEPIALVAAPTRDQAQAAAQHILVDYEPLEPLFDFERSEGNPIRVFGEDNVYSRMVVERGGVDAAMAAADCIVRGTYRVGLQEQLYIEPQGIIAIPRDDGGLTLIGSMQCPFYIVKALRRVLGNNRFNVVQAVTGGAFGGKEEYPSILSAHAALLARKSGRPVKLIYRRDEDLRATTKRHPAILRYETAVDPKTGQLLALDADLLFDGGAYKTLSPVVLSRGVLHGTGPYRCPHVRLAGRMVATHTTPNGAFRGFGVPQSIFAAERHIDRIARELGLDPIDVRRANLMRDGDISPTGQTLTDVAATTVLDKVLAADAPLPTHSVADRPGGGRQAARLARGTGLSLSWHGAGFTGNGEAGIKGTADLALEGDRVVVYVSSTDLGQGTETIFPQIVASELQIPVDRVSVAQPDTAVVPDSGPTVASRTAMVVGRVVQQGAKRLYGALRAEIGGRGTFEELLGRRTTSIPLRVRSTYEDECNLQWDPATYKGDAYPTYSWSCARVDLDVDRDTGEVFYRRFVQATDVGRALNPVLAAGQLEGGALQGLGYATCEQVVLDEARAMANNRLTNYIIPTTLDAPEMHTILVENPFHAGPFGAKGIGEIPADGPAPAVAQAIENAMSLVLDELPMTPERILAADDAAETRSDEKADGDGESSQGPTQPSLR